MRAFANLVLLFVAASVARVAHADPATARCANCGCSQTRKVCRLICKVQEEVNYEYDVDHDDYCLPDTSKIRGKKWVPDCDRLLGRRKVLIWQPRCECKIHTRKTLVKIPVIKKVPTYNCVVENVCCQCGKSQVDPQATAQARQQAMMPDPAAAPLVYDTGEPVETASRPVSESQTGDALRSRTGSRGAPAALEFTGR